MLVASAIDLAHAALADEFEDFVVGWRLPDHGCS